MLRSRLTASLVVLTPVVLLMWLDVRWNFCHPGIWLIPLGLVGIWLTCGDLIALWKEQPHPPVAGVIYAGNMAIVLASSGTLLWTVYPADCPWGRIGWTLMGLFLAIGIALVVKLRRFDGKGGAMAALSLEVFSFCYVSVPLCLLLHLRTMMENRQGMIALVSVVFVVKFADAGAYFFGRAFGKKIFGSRNMAPLLSPKKTWEGVVGALVGGCLTAWIALDWLPSWLSIESPTSSARWAILVYGLLLTVAGIFGDLAESLIKRDSAVKDSSSLLPGLGGMLDVFDSILIATPVAYVCWTVGLV